MTVRTNDLLCDLGRRMLVFACLMFAPRASAVEPATEASVSAERLEALFSGESPAGIADLRAMEKHLQELYDRVLSATVGVQVGSAQGSGVIIDEAGHVLTAAHVIGKPGRPALVVSSDGRRLQATTLGTFRTMDAGLIKIDPLPRARRIQWSHVEMGDSSGIKTGQWCLAIGHPGGIQEARLPAARFGRVLTINPTNALTTDCTLIGGDSGGPLFNMQGKVVAIHSRIGSPLTANLHIPINAYRESWERLVKGESWGHVPGQQPYIGVRGKADSAVAEVTQVFAGSPAEKAGIRVGDTIVSLAGQPIRDFAELRGYVEDQEPGTKVIVEVQRGDEKLMFDVVIGRIRE